MRLALAMCTYNFSCDNIVTQRRETTIPPNTNRSKIGISFSNWIMHICILMPGVRFSCNHKNFDYSFSKANKMNFMTLLLESIHLWCYGCIFVSAKQKLKHRQNKCWKTRQPRQRIIIKKRAFENEKQQQYTTREKKNERQQRFNFCQTSQKCTYQVLLWIYTRLYIDCWWSRKRITKSKDATVRRI